MGVPTIPVTRGRPPTLALEVGLPGTRGSTAAGKFYSNSKVTAHGLGAGPGLWLCYDFSISGPL